MDVIDAIQNRRSIRRYRSDDLSNDIILKIIEAGTLAPSAKNRQPWKFIILKERDKDAISDLMLEHAELGIKYEYETQQCKSSIKNTANIIKQAPVLILVFKDNNKVWEVGDTLSIGACVENMLLYATGIGVGSLWIRDTFCIEDEINRMYGSKLGMVLSCAVALGISAEAPEARPRKQVTEVVELL